MPTGDWCNIGGKRIIEMVLTMPYYGMWCADVVMAVPAADTLTIQPLQVNDLVLSCFTYRGFSFGGFRGQRVAAGFGGWRKTLPAKAYQAPGGLNLSLVLGDAAAECGEKVVVTTDQSIGTAFVRQQAPASRTLAQLTNFWWVDNNGVTQVGPRPTNPITSQFQVLEYRAGQGQFTISTETLADWIPGRTFTAPTVPIPQQVLGVTHYLEQNGKYRLQVLCEFQQ